MKRHHKLIIGISFSSLIIIFMITISIFTYSIYVQQRINFNTLEQEITNLQTDTQLKINDLTTSIIQIENELNSLGSQIGSIDEDISLLKASTSTDFSGIIEDVIKSVVTIKTNIGQGTGFIIEEGYIVTNYHVIEGATSAGVYTYDGETHSVTLVGYNENMDIALLKIEEEYKSLILEDSENIQIGEKVIAIGNPLGLQFSVSEGIVSAIHRTGPNNLDIYIQTTAELNSGNSGGPLINKKGKVIGMNNFKISDTEGLGFALESNYIKQTVNEISRETTGEDLI